MAFQKKKDVLSASESMIMKVVWDAGGDISIQDLLETLRVEYEKEYKRTSIDTFLDRMAAKGFITTFKRGRTAFVHSVMAENTYKAELMEENVKFWFKGQTSEAVAALSSRKKFSKEEIKAIRSLLDAMDD